MRELEWTVEFLKDFSIVLINLKNDIANLPPDKKRRYYIFSLL